MVLRPLPREDQWLNRFHLDARRRVRAGAQGGHLTRRRGQSLRFREFTPYLAGDDIRAVDWRQSARFGPDHDLLVRRFEAEEPLTLIVTLDARPSMWLPQPLPKMQIALWLTEALARLTCKQGDTFVLHQLATGKVYPVKTRRAADTLVERCRLAPGETAPVNLGQLERTMPPAAVWLVVSDFYSEAPQCHAALADLWRRAARKHVWRTLIDVNAWPMERALLGQGARHILGPGQRLEQPFFQVDNGVLAQVEQRIQTAKHAVQQPLQLKPQDARTWFWPEQSELDADAALAFFRAQFQQDPLLKRLFMR
ncbi:DUF58 domain-containing protein [Acanthopleuribacter pedis]|uniref:DUF58 domain-containing protein n=1 Tax=Acanthopleuribacter pedis TaxID=442870 RepID=A0A8J7QLM6_9BACT|nr:DUF58 domain-containing protein [Acanthopleuribacter pedis]MBO1320573.1 DUF58 domain-containing protein [Acanthopleuribacter pedis]